MNQLFLKNNNNANNICSNTNTTRSSTHEQA